MHKVPTPLCCFSIGMLLLLVAQSTHASGQESELEKGLKRCSNKQAALDRLNCYDRLVEKHQLVVKQKYIRPPAKFLSSKLTATPWHDEYKLTVEDFVNLIKAAVMEDGEKIDVHGWTKQGRDYVLNITMRRPLHLRFLPFESATDEIPLSLLRKLIIDGEATDPELFITTIASMVPDKKTNESQ